MKAILDNYLRFPFINEVYDNIKNFVVYYDTYNERKYINLYEIKNGEILLFRNLKPDFYYEVEDRRILGEECNMKSKITLREEQKEIVEEFFNEGILVAPTGFGKTVVALHFIAMVNRPAIVLVHTNFLKKQWEERIVQFIENPAIDVRTVQSLYRYDEYPEANKYGIVICDEVHRTSAPLEFSRVINLFPARYRIGLSATPRRKDGLHKIFEAAISSNYIFAKTKAIDYEAYVVRTGLRVPLMFRKDKFNLVSTLSYLEKIQVKRNAIIAKYIRKALDKGRKVLVLAERNSILERLAKLFPNSSIMTYKTKKKDTSGNPILAGLRIGGEGLDIPELDTLFIVTPVFDKNKFIQCIGRTLRRSEKKKPIIVYFIDDNPILEKSKYTLKKAIQELNETFFEE